MATLLILGAGGHGKVAAAIAASVQTWERIAFLDDRAAELQIVGGHEVLAGFGEAESCLKEFTNFFVAVGDNRLRLELLNRYLDRGHKSPPLVHPTAWIAPSATLGEGTLAGPKSVVHVNAQVGRACIVNTAATVDHDCVLEDGVHLSPGVHLAGEVRIGRETMVGVGTAVANRVTIGRNAVIGAGSAVVEDIPENVTAAGVPARILRAS